MPCKTENLVNRKLRTQCHHFLPGFGDNLICIAGSQGVYHIANPVADKFKFPLFETARCARRRSDANARGYLWRHRVKRNGILVTSHMCRFQSLFRYVTGQTFRPQINQQQMRIGSAGN